jgi:hypothetical protein
MHLFALGTPSVAYIIKNFFGICRTVVLVEKEDAWKVFGQDPNFFVFKSEKKEPIDDLVIVKLHHFVKIRCCLEIVVFYWVYWAEIWLACEELVA